MIQPQAINHNSLMGSVFQNSECEIILRNILMLQKSKDKENWQPFSWEEYQEFCNHNVSDRDKGVLNAFVNGGKPVWNTSAYLSEGWLSFSDGKYHFTEKIITMLQEKHAIV